MKRLHAVPVVSSFTPRWTRRSVKPLAISTALLTVAFSLSLSGSPADATFHGRNGRIAYSLDRGSGAEIYTITPGGTDRRRLTSVNGSALEPDWSPDGRRIVFEVDHPDGCSVEIMDRDGSHVRDLTGPGHPCDLNPAFTPGGHRIVFVARGGDGPIMSMNLRGGDRRVIFRGRGLYKKEPQVSPNGRKVLFLVEKDLGVIGGIEDNVKALYTVRMNGTHFKKVVPFRFDVCACGGDWSPSGKRIAFSNNAGAADEPQTRPTNLATIRPNGSHLRFVTHFTSVHVYVSNGTYSPNGRWILFRTTRDDKNVLWKIHPDGTHKTPLARFAFSPGSRDWGPRPN